MKKFVSLFFYFSLIIAIGGAYFYPEMKPFLGAGQPCVKFVGTLPSTLSGAGVSSSASSIPLSSLEIQQTNQKLTMSDFCDVGYATLEPGNTSKQEFISFTGVTQNSNGSAILTGVTRGLSPIYPYTASSSVRFNHSGGTRVVISNSPPFYGNFVVQGNNATITAQQIFSSTTPPHYDLVPANHNAGTYVSTTSEFVSWAGLAAVTNSGTVNAEDAVKGIVEMATAAEASSTASTGGTGARTAIGGNLTSGTPGASLIPVAQSTGKLLQGWFDLAQTWIFSGGTISTASSTNLATTTAQTGVKTLGVNIFGQFVASTTITGQNTPQPVFLATTTNSLYLSEADGNASSTFLGFAVSGALNGATTTVQIEGIVPGFSGLTRGQRYYVSDTAGTISTTQGTNEVIVGTAISGTEIMVTKNPDGVWQYVGSGSCTTSTSCTIPIPSLARFAIVKTTLSTSNGCGGGTGGSGGWTLIVAKVGATTVTGSASPNCGDGVASNGPNTSTVAWGSSNITITNSIGGADLSVQQDAYFYR